MKLHGTYKLSRRQFSTLLAVGFFLIGTLFSLSAQTTQGNAGVNGAVRDVTGAVIPGAKVVLTETSRHLDRETLTNSVGSYLFPSVTPGIYSLHVSKDGFEIYQLNDIRFDVGQLATLDVALKAGSELTVISVSADQQVLLDHDSNALGTVIDSAQVDKLPLNGRNFLDLVKLSGGSAELDSGGVPSGAVGAQGGHPSRAVAIAGNMPYMTGYVVDGIGTRGTRLGESAVNLSVAAIDQFKVQQSFFMPDQGPNSALVSVTTKGGGNAVHGQVFEFLRNKVFDATNYFSLVKDDLKRNQFGGAVGGPVIKNKIWFYGFYEGLREIRTSTASAYTPTAAMFGGDFSALTIPIYDPDTYNAITGLRTGFTGNVIPASRINPVSAKLLAYYLPGSSLATKPSNLTQHPRSKLNDNQFGIRIDAGISKRQTIYGQYIHDNSPAVTAGIQPLQGTLYQEQADLFVLTHTFTISPRLVNTARFGALRNLLDNSNVAVNGGDLQTGIGLTNTNDKRGLSSISFTGYGGLGSGVGDLGNTDNSYQIDESMYYSRGRHTFQFGGNIRYFRAVQENLNAQALGSFGFQKLFTAQSSPTGPKANTGDAFADFLLGYPATGTVAGLPKIPYRYTQASPYFSDLWKITPNFTMNYGISWFLATTPNPVGVEHNWPHSFDFSTGLLTYAALGQVDPKVVPFDKRSIAPRLGFVLSPDQMPHTVFRAGFGIYYTDMSLPSLQYAISAPPYGGANAFTQVQTNPLPGHKFGVNTFPPMSLPTFDINYAANLPTGTSPLLLDPTAKNPTLKQWNASVQHSVGDHDVIELDYLGSAGQHLELFYDSDQCKTAPDLKCDYSTRPYPKYLSLDTAGFNGNSSYEAMILKYTHRTGGLDIHSEYTLGKALGNGMSAFHDTVKIQNSNCLSCNYARTSFDQHQTLSVSAIYALPFGKGRAIGRNMPALVNDVVGGWTVTTIGSMTTGVPVALTSTNTTNTVNTSYNLPNRTCDGNDRNLLGNLRTNGHKAFNTACFSVPTSGYFGNSRQNVITGPGNNNWDIGIQKSFPLVFDNAHLEFRGEMFNAFNHAQFSNPAGAVQSPATFGIVSAARSPRIGQISAKIVF